MGLFKTTKSTINTEDHRLEVLREQMEITTEPESVTEIPSFDLYCEWPARTGNVWIACGIPARYQLVFADKDVWLCHKHVNRAVPGTL
jgi:hypothetical protein